jgi:hypothetical protein
MSEKLLKSKKSVKNQKKRHLETIECVEVPEVNSKSKVETEQVIKKARNYPINDCPMQTWKILLSKTIVIPMTQRQYEWSNKELEKFFDDIIEIFDDQKYRERMGNLIMYKEPNFKHEEIHDGQQRTISILLLCMILFERSKMVGKQKKLFTYDTAQNKYYPEVSRMIYNLEKQFKISEHFPKHKFCNVFCVNDHDQLALTLIFNGFYKSPYKYMMMDKRIPNKYFCLNCINDNVKTGCTRKQDFFRHLNETCKSPYHHDKCLPDIVPKHFYGMSNIYAAYDYMYQRFVELQLDETEIEDLFHFITNDVVINLCISSDILFISKIFQQENNRGKPVAPIDIIKSNMLRNLNSDQKTKVYDNWTKCKSLVCPNNIFDNYGEHLFTLAIQIYNKSKRPIPVKMNDPFEWFKPLLDLDVPSPYIIKKIKSSKHKVEQDSEDDENESTESEEENHQEDCENEPSESDEENPDENPFYCEINKFLKIVNDCHQIIVNVSNNRYGRLLVGKKNISCSWFDIQYMIVPFLYHSNQPELMDSLLKLCVQFISRNFVLKKRHLCGWSIIYNLFSQHDKVIQNPQHNYIPDLCEFLKRYSYQPVLSSDFFINQAQQTNFTNTELSYLLFIYETFNNTDTYIVPFGLTLEHIHCKNRVEELNNQKLVNQIGNTTLLEGENSQNGHKGNKSLKDKPYVDKKQYYERSSVPSTIKLAKDYQNFDENSIIERSNSIATKLEEFTHFF